MKRARGTQPAMKADIEEVAAMAGREFRVVHNEIKDVRKDTHNAFQNSYEEFAALRKEMQEGFRAVLAAVETVEYTKLRMRIDALESDVQRMKERMGSR